MLDSGVVQVAEADLRFDMTVDMINCDSKFKETVFEELSATQLLTYPEDFRNTITAGETRPWIYAQAMIASNVTTAPDGTLTADKFVENMNTSITHNIYRSDTYVSGTNYEWSLYLKAGQTTVRTLNLRLEGTAFPRLIWLNYNPHTGVVVLNSGSPLSYSMESVGSGWYRCKLVFTAQVSGAGLMYLRLATSATQTYTGDGISGVYIWGAKLAVGSTITTYIPQSSDGLFNLTNHCLETPSVVNFENQVIPAHNNTLNFRLNSLPDGTMLTRNSIGSYQNSNGIISYVNVNEPRFDYDYIKYDVGNLIVVQPFKNILTYPEDFRDTATAGETRPWVYANITITANNTTSPDGTINADKMIETVATAGHYIDQLSLPIAAGSTIVFSTYIKNASGSRWMLLWIGASYSAYAHFNPITGAVGTTGASGYTLNSTSSTYIGNGWYRVSMIVKTITETSIRCRIQLKASNGGSTSYAGDGTSGIYIWGAKIESSSVLLPYGTVNSLTISQKYLLLEPQRTNIITYSEDFRTPAQAGYTTSWYNYLGASVTNNAGTAPDGTNTANRITENTATDQRRFRTYYFTVGGNTIYTVSMYVKPDANRKGISFYLFSTTPSSQGYIVDFNLDTLNMVGSISGGGTPTGISNIKILPDGWYRLEMTITFPVIVTNLRLYAYFSSVSTDGNAIYIGDGVSGLYVWGAQLEAGSNASSYIPTTVAAATRAADSLSLTLPIGSTSLTYTFDDNSTQTISATAGSYPINPSILSRKWIKNINISLSSLTNASYYTTVLSDNTFKLASNSSNAYNNINIVFSDGFIGLLEVDNTDVIPMNAVNSFSCVASCSDSIFVSTQTSKLELGDIITLTSTLLPPELSISTNYYVIPVSDRSYRIASSLINAQNNAFITFSSDFTGKIILNSNNTETNLRQEQ
jgi:hypothetical protein